VPPHQLQDAVDWLKSLVRTLLSVAEYAYSKQ
jgi:hypothetical protein